MMNRNDDFNKEQYLKVLIDKIFENDSRIFIDDEISYPHLKEKAQEYDKEVMSNLYKNEKTRKHFFEEIDCTYIFLLDKFLRFIDSKSIAESYTGYKNRIGLFVNDNNDVVLNFPFKDCVLQGGQTKDDAKHNEIFFNEIIAYDEIDMLLSEKAFCFFKQYSTNNKEKFNGFKRDENGMIKDNLLIKGNNLLTLHSLKYEFKDKIKLIYIDPPYNTGGDSFNYNDKFNHSTWLVFIKNRLEIARELLSDDGVIFVQCDDNEQAYLKVLMDEIFGRENFISNFMWLHGKGKKNKNVRTLQQYSLCFAKKIDLLESWTQVKTIEGKLSNPDNDDRGSWFSGSISFSEDRSNKNHRNYYSIKSPSGIVWSRQWLCDKKVMDEYIQNNKIYFGASPDYENVPREKIFPYEEKEVIPENIFFDAGTTRSANNDLKVLFGENVFVNPKSEQVIERIIEISTKEGDIVLDFCAGSGTTLAVAHKMNRQYIGIEQMDYIETITSKRLKKVIEGEQGGISKSVGWQGGGEFIYFELSKFNNKCKENILSAKDIYELKNIFNEMKNKYFINYNSEIKFFEEQMLDNKDSNFYKFRLEEQKKLLIEMLDKNQMYVPKSEMEDAIYDMNKEDIEHTKGFYKGIYSE